MATPATVLIPEPTWLNTIATMDKIRIQGGKPLRGEVRISGAKNSALPCIAASLLTAENLVLRSRRHFNYSNP
jgi:hypothetical protein